MVNLSKKGFMVLWLVLSTLPLLVGSVSLAAESTVKIYPKQVMLGQPVTLVLNGEQALRDFDKLDFNALKRQFAIHEIDSSSDQIRLRLYPLSAGLLAIPETKAASIHIPHTPITVKPNSEVSITWQSPKSHAYTGENLLWKAVVELKNAANLASLSERLNPNWQIQYQEQAASEQTNKGVDSEGKTVVLVANYQFTGADTNRTQIIQSPAVIVKNRSNRRWLFFDAPQSVNILPLPQFLPVNMTVGKVNLNTINDGFFKIAGDLNYWVWQLQADNVDQFALHNLAHTLIAQIDHNERLEWLSESREIESRFTERGLRNVLTIRLPYRAVTAGLLILPELNLQYFDVESGKLVSDFVEPNRLVALPIWLVWVAQWLMLMLGLLLMYGLLWKSKQVWLNWRLRNGIRRAQSSEQLIKAMFDWQAQQKNAVPLPYVWPFRVSKVFKGGSQNRAKISRPASLEQFQQVYEARYGESASLTKLIKTLNQQLYASGSNSHQAWPCIEKILNNWLKSVSIW